MKSKFENRTEEILNSFDGIESADVPSYFYTRLIGRMQHELLEKKEPFLLLRPAFLTASLSAVLIINIIFLFQFNGQQRTLPSKQSTNDPTIESFADAYDLNTTTVYE